MATVKGIELSSEIYDIEDETSRSDITTIESVIPTNASAENPLATAEDVEDIPEIKTDVTNLKANVGNLDDLETTEKTSIVGAINENVANISSVTPIARKQELLSKYNGKTTRVTVPYTTRVVYSEDILAFYGKGGIVSSEDAMYLSFSVTADGISLNALVSKVGNIPNVGTSLGSVYLAIGKNKIKELLVGLGTTSTEQEELEELYELLNLSYTNRFSAPYNSFQGEPGVECLVNPYSEVINYLSSGNIIAKQVIFNYGPVFAIISAGSYSGSQSNISPSIIAN